MFKLMNDEGGNYFVISWILYIFYRNSFGISSSIINYSSLILSYL